jgi:endonuclease/exonuclease/phosphatase family metal-dependent hydrolase
LVNDHGGLTESPAHSAIHSWERLPYDRRARDDDYIVTSGKIRMKQMHCRTQAATHLISDHSFTQLSGAMKP